jgi:hypothetical protein
LCGTLISKGKEKLYLNFDTISPPFEVMPNDYT